ARALRLGHVTIHGHTKSLRLLNATMSHESTSHILASFAPGDIVPRSVTTTLVFGDASHATFATMQRRLETLKGTENRLFRGQDEMVATGLPTDPAARRVLLGSGFTDGASIDIGDISLGDFLPFISDDPSAFEGLAVGLVASPQGTDLHLFPLGTDMEGNIRLLTGTERQAWLDLRADMTEDVSVSSGIRQGVVRSTP
ncbi:MAG: hypothetical protein V1745_01165, partial [Patescibacteria group bacterium]